jgi:hypothetical protein
MTLVMRATRLRGKLGCEPRSGEGALRSGTFGELTLSTGVGGRDTGRFDMLRGDLISRLLRFVETGRGRCDGGGNGSGNGVAVGNTNGGGVAVEGGGSNGPHLGNVSGGGVGALGSGISGICSAQYQWPS